MRGPTTYRPPLLSSDDPSAVIPSPARQLTGPRDLFNKYPRPSLDIRYTEDKHHQLTIVSGMLDNNIPIPLKKYLPLGIPQIQHAILMIWPVILPVAWRIPLIDQPVSRRSNQRPVTEVEIVCVLTNSPIISIYQPIRDRGTCIIAEVYPRLVRATDPLTHSRSGGNVRAPVFILVEFH